MADVIDLPVIEKGDFRDGRKKYRYLVDGEPTRSVTEIIEWVFGKGKFGAGAWWGQEQGVKGTLKLMELLGDEFPADDWEAVVDHLKLNKLTTNHVKSDAADRGTAVHDAAEQFAMFGTVPNPADFPPEWQGYVKALALWIVDFQPKFLKTEVTVGSARHGYAGTFDMVARIGDRVGLGDYKTGKRLYESVFYQLEAYEIAAQECGHDPTDFRFAVSLKADGTYEYEESKVTPEDWLIQLAAYQSQVAAEQRRKA